MPSALCRRLLSQLIPPAAHSVRTGLPRRWSLRLQLLLRLSHPVRFACRPTTIIHQVHLYDEMSGRLAREVEERGGEGERPGRLETDQLRHASSYYSDHLSRGGDGGGGENEGRVGLGAGGGMRYGSWSLQQRLQAKPKSIADFMAQ